MDFRFRIKGWLWAVVAAGLSGLCPAGAAPRPVPNFNLLDLHGVDHELYRAGGRAVVLFFTGTGCPIARKSAPKVRDLQERFGGQGVSVWIINTYPGDSVRDARREAGELGLAAMPYLRDPRQGVALALGVERTAEVVAIRTSDWRVFYQGAIDDQFAEGAERPAPTVRHLEGALTSFLAGNAVSVSRTPARGCRIAFAPVAEAQGPPAYATQVAPLLRKHCVDCHREGSIAPWAMDGFERVRNHARMIEEVLLTRRMPPWDPDPGHGRFAHGPTLDRDEVQTLLSWVQAGAPRGEGTDPLVEPLPPIPPWPLGTPHAVTGLDRPETVPATGVLDYRQIPVRNPFTNEVWLSGLDVRPGNRRVVHHAILYGRWPGCEDDGTGQGVHLCGWAPGTPPTALPPGVARRLPAGAELRLEMHYTTSGREETDQTEVAFYLAPGPQEREATIRRAFQPRLDIPPGVAEARHEATYAFVRPATLYSLSPHMHVRGKWMRYELLLPDGRRETLLHVPRYDFLWQFSYVLAQPRRVPAGSWLLVTGAFDNSTGKPGNPDPARQVRFGLQSWDEMFIGFFEAADDPVPPAGGSVAGAAGLP